MKGIIKFFDKKRNYGFIYGTGSIEKDGKEIILPEFFVHASQVKGRPLKNDVMVEFTPHEDEKGISAVDVTRIKYDTQYDPNYYIANRILEEFDIKIPCISWMQIQCEDMAAIYNYLKAKKNQDDTEMKQLVETYGAELEQLSCGDAMACIAAGGYEIWKYQCENSNVVK